MGLDTSHDCWHGGPYSAFTRWRRELAKVAGLPPLDLMEGFWSRPTDDDAFGIALTVRVCADSLDRAYPPRPGPDPGRSQAESLRHAFDFDAIRWDALRPDPLHALLSHSDCDGEIAAADCGPLADSLERLLPALESSGIPGCRGSSMRETTERFIAGLRLAASRGENVVFA